MSSLFGLALLTWVASSPAGIERSFADFLGSLPDFLAGIWQLLLGVLVALPVAMLVAALVRRR